jgi:hypothetical protein
MTFTLQQKLTAIYTSFDSIRNEYGIEKVPSTGFSYIAISSRQHQQPAQTSDHVVRMTRFAAACQQKLRTTVFPYLSNNSREDDVLRTIRFGIHYGQISDSAVEDDARESTTVELNLRNNIEKAMFLQSYVIDNNNVSFFHILPHFNSFFFNRRTSSSGEIQVCKATAKRLKSIEMGSLLNRRTDGRLVFATYWLHVESNDNIVHNLTTLCDV